MFTEKNKKVRIFAHIINIYRYFVRGFFPATLMYYESVHMFTEDSLCGHFVRFFSFYRGKVQSFSIFFFRQRDPVKRVKKLRKILFYPLPYLAIVFNTECDCEL